MVTLLRSAQMRSPNTPFEAQLRVDFGFLKTRGLTNIQTIASARGIRHRSPIHARLQIASASSESTLNLVHTLSGFAWRIQCSPSSPKALATRLSVVALTGCEAPTEQAGPVQRVSPGSP